MKFDITVHRLVRESQTVAVEADTFSIAAYDAIEIAKNDTGAFEPDEIFAPYVEGY